MTLQAFSELKSEKQLFIFNFGFSFKKDLCVFLHQKQLWEIVKIQHFSSYKNEDIFPIMDQTEH